MYKQFIGTVVLSCSLFAGQGVFAHSHSLYNAHCSEKLSKLLDSLKLEGDQKTKIETIITDMKTALKEKSTRLSELRKQISEQIESSQLDKAKLDSTIDEKAGLIGGMMKAKANAKHDIYQVLNDKQKADFKAKLAEEDKRMAVAYKSCNKQED